jgi:hypothetical protein
MGSIYGWGTKKKGLKKKFKLFFTNYIYMKQT